MGEEGKKIWMLRAKQEREAYNKEYAEWLENGGAEAIENVKITLYVYRWLIFRALN